jgi:hypothetical protein
MATLYGRYDSHSDERNSTPVSHFRGHANQSWQWAQGLILKLLKATHGQWLYWNVQIHDTVLGTQVTIRKEAIQKEIKEQMELGETGLLEEDNWMLEVSLGDLESTSGEQEQYWLVAIKAAWEAAMITWQNEQAPRTQPQKRRRALF